MERQLGVRNEGRIKWEKRRGEEARSRQSAGSGGNVTHESSEEGTIGVEPTVFTSLPFLAWKAL